MRARILKRESEKKALISKLSNEERTLMSFYEEEPEKNLPHEKVGESVTLVHPPYDYESLERWLYLGNWQAIFPGNKDFQPFNTFRTSLSEIEQRMKEANIKLIVDSFHDDIEWNVIEET
jgi:hypothetical protein